MLQVIQSLHFKSRKSWKLSISADCIWGGLPIWMVAKYLPRGAVLWRLILWYLERERICEMNSDRKSKNLFALNLIIWFQINIDIKRSFSTIIIVLHFDLSLLHLSGPTKCNLHRLSSYQTSLANSIRVLSGQSLGYPSSAVTLAASWGW